MGKHHDWSDVDWSMTSAEIAEIKGCPKTTVDSARQRLAPGSSKAYRGTRRTTRVVTLTTAAWDTLDALCIQANKSQDAVLSRIILLFGVFLPVCGDKEDSDA